MGGPLPPVRQDRGARGPLSRYLCPTDRRGIHTDVSDAGLKLLREARPTNDTALKEALDEAAKNSEPDPLVTAVEAMSPTR
ncbi:hypothetical protein [Streptosporangium sandarakinum]|uniref:hypothetical protein n=1 Tax=Streptosporangium sandarakinum TaxID=1260955 RepID=UPI0033A09DD2